MPEEDPVAFCQAYWRARVPAALADPSSIDQVLPEDLCDQRNEWPQFLGVGHLISNLGDWDWTEKMSGLRTRTLVVHGAQDNIPLASSREWAHVNNFARLLIIQNAGHLPYAEQPAVFTEAVSVFLEGAWPEEAEDIQ